MRRLLLTATLGALAACAPSAPPQRFPEKPPGCALETVKVLPQRPYLELETFDLPGIESAGDAFHRVHDRACKDGADAVYLPKGGKTYSYAIALRWTPAPAPAPAPATPPPAPASLPLPPAPAPDSSAAPPPAPAAPAPAAPAPPASAPNTSG